ncbi:hypothetical protein GGE24_002677 [Bradyrhizobium centrosematis]|nr:hypothetical protein [Bradyrhizobium centrosematis]MCS3773365.1 hypothetical protein [Bradyrhizobium centrosematis]
MVNVSRALQFRAQVVPGMYFRLERGTRKQNRMKSAPAPYRSR